MIKNSSVGRKVIMALAGLVWTGFVFGHMVGNLLIFYSAEAYNKYGHAIVSNKILLYGTELTLSLAILCHVFYGVKLSMENRAARKQKYFKSAKIKSGTWASKTMMIHGSVILAFIIYHLITFKYGPHYTITYDGVEMRDLYRLIVEVFQNPAYVLGYIICLLLLGIHLSHGASSIFQTMGLNHPSYTPVIKKLGFIYGVVVAVGFISQPVYVFLFVN